MTAKQYYRKLLIERFIKYVQLACFVFLATCSLWIISLCLDDKNTADRLNKCLKTHTLDYCNNHIK